ncbi:hypothetical protein TNCT_513761 [Trichonephila clavata]|uniref:Uncharacterized protein n=1 Tax=Trichonephila clavata TaxID=2740835 RepID=A0A8X6KVG4_TRICU|nr:hypothetical protein TNCT_513761 [Trichonephila clavata]
MHVIDNNSEVSCSIQSLKTYHLAKEVYEFVLFTPYSDVAIYFDQGSPTPKLFNFLHWLVVNIPDNNVSEGTTKVAYATTEVPLKGYLTHILLVYQQTRNLSVVTHGEGSRNNFDINNFVEFYGLKGPKSGNFFFPVYREK